MVCVYYVVLHHQSRATLSNNAHYTFSLSLSMSNDDGNNTTTVGDEEDHEGCDVNASGDDNE